jgi:hypothetical protein
MTDSEPFSRDNLPPAEQFARYRKRHLTAATRIDGPFTVCTQEGELSCPDGWLAIDSRGWPYPIAADEFDAIYEPAP